MAAVTRSQARPAGLTGELRSLRNRIGKSLRELESETFVSDSSLSRYFTGQTLPPWTVVEALCRLAGRDPRRLRSAWSAARRKLEPCRNDLPRDVPDFVGRGPQLATLLAVGPVACVDGMVGVGKTALVVRVAHRLAGGYPDGQYYVDLRGSRGDPVDPATALGLLLSAAGVREVPGDTAGRAALWRATVADRRVVVVLDDAADAGQVRPLLPGTSASRVLITGRDRLFGLEGACQVSLDVLPTTDAAGLFVRLAGRPADVEPDALAEVLRLCGRLPIALRGAAAKLRRRPMWSVGQLAERLRERLLDEVDVDGVIADAIRLSLGRLDPGGRRILDQMGHDDIDAEAAASLIDRPVRAAEQALEDLLDRYLLTEVAAGRYRVPELVRAFMTTA